MKLFVNADVVSVCVWRTSLAGGRVLFVTSTPNASARFLCTRLTVCCSLTHQATGPCQSRYCSGKQSHRISFAHNVCRQTRMFLYSASTWSPVARVGLLPLQSHLYLRNFLIFKNSLLSQCYSNKLSSLASSGGFASSTVSASS